MSQAAPIEPEALSLDQRLDRQCGDFEKACKAARADGAWPRIEDFLGTCATAERAVLLRELVLLELHYRRQAGERPDPAAYQGRFPELTAAWLAQAVREAPAADAPAAASAGLETDPPALEFGDAIPRRLGEYCIRREIGRGGMGVVYEAVQESLGRHVALKVLPFPGLLGPTHLERFQAEARAAARLHHTNIVPVFGVGADQGVHYYAMQYIEGQGLDRVLREVRRLRGPRETASTAEQPLAVRVAQSLASGRFSPAERAEPTTAPSPVPPAPSLAGADDEPRPDLSESPIGRAELGTRSETRYFQGVARIGVQVAEALDYAHRQGILHRDIKPSNLLLDTAGRVWITDFGLAKTTDGEGLTGPGDLVGTLPYMAPERFRGQSDPRSDVYSLGLTLYELATLRPGFAVADAAQLLALVGRERPPAPRALDPCIPSDLETIILKAIAPESAQRYPTAAALAEDLRRFLADRPILARRTSSLEHLWRWCRRNRAVATLAVGLLAALVILAVGSTVASVLLGWERDRAVQAKQEEARKLWDSYLEQAHAGRLSRQAGQRFTTLETLRKAVELGRSLDLSPEKVLRLRNELIACTALVDLGVEAQLEPTVALYYYVALNERFEFYAFSDLAGNVTLRRVADRQEIGRFPGPMVPPKWVALQLSKDGRWLVVGYTFANRPSEFHRWDLRTGKPESKIALDEPVKRLDISPDSRWLALERSDGTVGIYDLRSGRLENKLGPARTLQRIVFHPNGRLLGILPANNSRSLQVWDLETGRIVSHYDHNAVVNSAAWRSDGRLLAVGCDDQRVYVWDTVGHVLQATLEGHRGNGLQVCFSHSGELLISTGWDETTRMWDPVSGQEMLHTPGVFVALRNDDRQLALYRAGQLLLCEVAGLREFRTLHHGQVGNRTDRPGAWGPRCVSFSGDGQFLASASLDGVRLWDVRAPATEIAYLPVGSSGAALFQPGGRSLLTYGAKGLRLWPFQGQPPDPEGHLVLGPPRLLTPLSGGQTLTACWSADGRSLLAADSKYNRALLLQLDDPGKPLELKPHRNLDWLALSPGGDWAATFGWQSNDLIVWNATTGTEAWRRTMTRANAAFSPAGQLLVTISAEQGIGFWDVASGQMQLAVPATGAPPFAITFNADGTMLAIAESGHGIRLLNPATGRELATLDAPYDHMCRWLSFSPDGSQLAASTGNHTIQLWDLRLLRQHLADLDIDWELPPYPPAKAPGARVRLEVRLDADLLYARALHWERAGDYTQAIADLRACLKEDPGCTGACNFLAWLLVAGPAELRSPDEALPLAEKAVARRPDDANSQNTLGVAYYRLGRYEQAVETLTRNRRQSRGRLAACDGFFLAMSYQRLAQTEQARDCFFQAVREQTEAKLSGRLADQLNAVRAEAEALLGTPAAPLPR